MKNATYRAGAGIALGGAALLIWLSLGVGIIGRDGDPANLMYFGVVAVGAIGSALARFRPHSMVRVLLAMALVQALIGAFALVAGLGLPWSGPLEILLLNGFFVGVFATSAWLFRRATKPSFERHGS